MFTYFAEDPDEDGNAHTSAPRAPLTRLHEPSQTQAHAQPLQTQRGRIPSLSLGPVTRPPPPVTTSPLVRTIRPGQDQAGTSSSSNDTRSTFRPGATPRR